MKTRWLVLVLAVQMLGPVAAGAQAPAPPIASPPPVTPTVGVPGNPTNAADPLNNPHPTMPWVGITTPYGQFLRWVWMPPRPVVSNQQVIYQPGFWVAQTTAGYHYPPRWVLQEVSAGTHGWVLVNGGAVRAGR
ncbi:MAG TPA: hypothetical protein VIE36_01585 [Methylomirabilota bacterium]